MSCSFQFIYAASFYWWKPRKDSTEDSEGQNEATKFSFQWSSFAVERSKSAGIPVMYSCLSALHVYILCAFLLFLHSTVLSQLGGKSCTILVFVSTNYLLFKFVLMILIHLHSKIAPSYVLLKMRMQCFSITTEFYMGWNCLFWQAMKSTWH